MSIITKKGFSPYISNNGNWFVYNQSLGNFVDTGILAVQPDDSENIPDELGEDYTELLNLPQINGITLTGNKNTNNITEWYNNTTQAGLVPAPTANNNRALYETDADGNPSWTVNKGMTYKGALSSSDNLNNAVNTGYYLTTTLPTNAPPDSTYSYLLVFNYEPSVATSAVLQIMVSQGKKIWTRRRTGAGAWESWHEYARIFVPENVLIDTSFTTTAANNWERMPTSFTLADNSFVYVRSTYSVRTVGLGIGSTNITTRPDLGCVESSSHIYRSPIFYLPAGTYNIWTKTYTAGTNKYGISSVLR